MITEVAAAAASELGLLRRDGTAYYIAAVAEALFEDTPVLEAFVDREVRAKVAAVAGCAPELVVVVHLSHAYLRDVLERHQRTRSWFVYDPDEVVPPGLAAIIGVRVPVLERSPS